jgi:hypothetical protein
MLDYTTTELETSVYIYSIKSIFAILLSIEVVLLQTGEGNSYAAFQIFGSEFRLVTRATW